MQKRLTIQDITPMAGVSKATISYTLNNNPFLEDTNSGHPMRI